MITVRVRGIEQLQKFLAELPTEVRKIAVQEVGEYLLGNPSHGLRHLVGYKYVSRKQAYGQTFVSDKQRRYVMAAIKDGRIKIPYSRTGATSAGWQKIITGGGFGAKLTNATMGARYAQGDDTQSRHEALVGHRKVSDVISTNIKGAMRAATQAIQRWINTHK